MRNLKVFVLSLMICVSPYYSNCQFRSRETYGNRDFYFTTSFTFDHLQNIFKPGLLETNFTYNTTDQSGKTSFENFYANWSPPNMIQKPYGTQVSFEFGNHSAFVTLGVGGFQTVASVFTAGVGANIFIPINCHSKIFYEGCLTIKPSISFGLGQSTPFNRGGNDQYLLGHINNTDKTINALGYVFGPTYTISATKNQSATTANAKSLDIYFMENCTFLFPKVTVGKNNYERLFYFSIDVGYFIPLQQESGIQLFQDKNYSEKTIWLSGDSPVLSYNGQSILNMPSFVNGLFIGVTVGLNLSREIFETYGTNNLRKNSEDYGKVCHCREKKNKISKNKKPKSQSKEKKLKKLKEKPSVKGS